MAATPDNTIITVTKSEFTWVKTHLILLGIIIVLVYGAVYLVEVLSDKRATQTDARWQQQVQNLQQSVTAHEQVTAQVQAQQSVLIGQLASAMAQRNAAVTKQQQTDATLSAVDASTRIATQTNAKPSEVTAQGDMVLLDLPIARTVVERLDLLPVVQANLTDTQSQLTAEKKVADSALTDITNEKALRTVDQKACTASINKLKADARKSKLKIFGIGYVAGLISGLLLHP